MHPDEKTELEKMKDRLEDLADSVEETKQLTRQIKEALMGNPVTNDGGLSQRLNKIEKRVEQYERLKWLIIGLAASAGFSIGELIDKLVKLF